MWYSSLVGAPGQWGMSNFRAVDRETGFLLPPSVDEWLPGQHLARFVVEVVESFRPQSDDGRLSWSGFGVVPSGGIAGNSGLWLRDRGVFEPPAGMRRSR
jgi:hypothetical protein